MSALSFAEACRPFRSQRQDQRVVPEESVPSPLGKALLNAGLLESVRKHLGDHPTACADGIDVDRP